MSETTHRKLVLSGEKIHTYRTSQHMSREELAEKSGVSRILIYRIEKGVTKSSGINTVAMIADVLGVNTNDLLEPKED